MSLPKKVLTGSIIMLSSLSLQAIQFESLGYKSISMGGASVANSSASAASYNNPALLAKAPYTVEVTISAGSGAYDFGARDAMVELEDIDFIDTLNRASVDINQMSTQDKQTLQRGTEIIVDMNGKAIAIEPQGYIGANIDNFGFGIYTTSDSAITATASPQHDQLYFNNNGNYVDINNNPITQQQYESRSIDYAVKNELSYFDVEGVAIAEVPIAYGHDFETNLGDFMIGGALKYIHAVTYVEKLSYDENSNNDSQRKDKQSSNFGIDLGFAYRPAFSYDLTLALVGKNLNSPNFDYYNGSSYSLKPMVRAGAAYKILDSLEVAADIDLTSNKLLNGIVESQMAGGGINYEPFSSFFALSLRAGLMKNINTHDQAGVVYTAGIGIGIKMIQIDLSAQTSGDAERVEGYLVPKYGKVNLALVSRW